MPDTQDTQVERISQLDIGDGKLYEFAGANSGIVFDTIAEAQAAITAGLVKDRDVFYVKYVSQGGTEVLAEGVGYDNADNGLDATNVQDAVNEIAENIGDTDISDIGDGTVTGAVSQLNSDLSWKTAGTNVSANTWVDIPECSEIAVEIIYKPSTDAFMATTILRYQSGSLVLAECIGGGNNVASGLLARIRYTLADQKIQFTYAGVIASSTTDVTSDTNTVMNIRYR